MAGMTQPVKALRDRVQMMVGRAVLAAVTDDKGFQELQVELLADETHEAVEHVQPYGFTAHARAGAEAVMLAVGGLRSHGLVIAVGDRRYRLRGLAEGEVAMHDDQGQKVHLTRDGIVIAGKALTITSDGDIDMTAEGAITLTGETIALASDDVALGNGATLEAARKTDAVSSTAITGGSTKVKIA